LIEYQQTIQMKLQKKIELLNFLATILSPEFGKTTGNPLLHGQNVGKIIQNYMDKQLEIALSLWTTEPTNQSRSTLRATLVYIRDILAEAMDADKGSVANMRTAKNISSLLNEIIIDIDSLRTAGVES
jgi:hypothetical protein